MVEGRQDCESTGTSNKRLAQKILDKRLAEIIEGRFRLPKSNPPRLKQFGEEFLDSIRHQNTRKRYASSTANLRAHFGDARLTEINAERIDEFKDSRLASKVRAATVNRDLAVLRRMLRIAERKRLITASPFREAEMLEERKERRQPHILTFKEEEKLLAVASDHIRVLAVLILDTGLRSGREALSLKWEDVDFEDEAIRIRQSKTLAGIRSVPMSSRCKAELLKWRTRLGPEFSEYVFANPQWPETHLRDVRRAWPKALKTAGLEYFWLYDLRHTFASRLTAAGVSPLFVAQIMGHSSPSILQTYAKAIDEFRRSAIAKLESFRQAQSVESAGRSEKVDTTLIQ
jgi:integrase